MLEVSLQLAHPKQALRRTRAPMSLATAFTSEGLGGVGAAEHTTRAIEFAEAGDMERAVKSFQVCPAVLCPAAALAQSTAHELRPSYALIAQWHTLPCQAAARQAKTPDNLINLGVTYMRMRKCVLASCWRAVVLAGVRCVWAAPLRTRSVRWLRRAAMARVMLRTAGGRPR